MIPFGTNTVTLLHREGDVYKRYTLRNCTWRQVAVRRIDSGVMETTLEIICRIPAGQKKPDTGDLLALGEAKIAAKNEIELVRLMQRMQEQGKSAMRILRVKDNSGGFPLPHYAASGA